MGFDSRRLQLPEQGKHSLSPDSPRDNPAGLSVFYRVIARTYACRLPLYAAEGLDSLAPETGTFHLFPLSLPEKSLIRLDYPKRVQTSVSNSDQMASTESRFEADLCFDAAAGSSARLSNLRRGPR